MAIFKLMPSTPEGVDPAQLELEVGTATYTNDGTSVTVRTRLSNIKGGFVTLVNDTTIATDEKAFFSVPTGAVSNGAIVISRSSSQAITDAAICYMLVGTRTTVSV